MLESKYHCNLILKKTSTSLKVENFTGFFFSLVHCLTEVHPNAIYFYAQKPFINNPIIVFCMHACI